ncbi:MAG: hypothetical protein AMJ64_02060 [Betaproteobacteria bacterium SG8_39]|nr:MAG: hypothetical protein AMJ64_02060 [Betaproteobacteria bacterium SG8_39]
MIARPSATGSTPPCTVSASRIEGHGIGGTAVAVAERRPEHAERRRDKLAEHVAERAHDHATDTELGVVNVAFHRHRQVDLALAVFQQRDRQIEGQVFRIRTVHALAERKVAQQDRVVSLERVVLDLVLQADVKPPGGDLAPGEGRRVRRQRGHLDVAEPDADIGKGLRLKRRELAVDPHIAVLPHPALELQRRTALRVRGDPARRALQRVDLRREGQHQAEVREVHCPTLDAHPAHRNRGPIGGRFGRCAPLRRGRRTRGVGLEHLGEIHAAILEYDDLRARFAQQYFLHVDARGIAAVAHPLRLECLPGEKTLFAVCFLEQQARDRQLARGRKRRALARLAERDLRITRHVAGLEPQHRELGNQRRQRLDRDLLEPHARIGAVPRNREPPRRLDPALLGENQLRVIGNHRLRVVADVA